MELFNICVDKLDVTIDIGNVIEREDVVSNFIIAACIVLHIQMNVEAILHV